ncbi:MAG: flagellar biosynthesis anti-sigma factor FlgM [Lachnospiraceae bacterium]|jgi:negative regulator of flagellin synthesis FlgM|nr:flagellar biosynthesis anti-sigma factor FlgM [Lachnospiraceae bacterium]MEE3460592.1 flagellar biosynthesis anti-sigma factor FlgM [Lachnospiraceae bacterium]
MRIDAYNQIANVYNTTSKHANTAKKSGYSFADALSVSVQGKDMAAAKEAVDKAPDVRADKVAYFKEQIAAGTYNVSAEAIADKLLKDYI